MRNFFLGSASFFSTLRAPRFMTESRVTATAGILPSCARVDSRLPQPAKSARSGDPGEGGCPYATWTGRSPVTTRALPLSAFDRGQRTLLALVRLQNLLAQAQRLRRDLDEFVVGNEFNRLFEIEIAVRHQADRLIRS